MPNVHLFYGNDSFSSTNKLKFWQTEFLKKYGEASNIEILDGSKLDPSGFLSDIQAMPFLSEKRLVIVKNFLSKGKTENQKRVAAALDHIPDFCILVFHEIEPPDKRSSLFKKISSHGKAEEFAPLSPLQATKWILSKSQTLNVKISQATANHLIQFCGTELFTLDNELEKLALFAGEKEITPEMIETLCTPSLTASVFKLTDSIAEKRPKESLRMLKILLDSGEEINKTFFMIIRHFRILIQVFDLLQKKETPPAIAKKIGQPPFVIQRMKEQAKNFDFPTLEKIYNALLKIDIAVKTGKIKSLQGDTSEFELAVEKFIITTSTTSTS